MQFGADLLFIKNLQGVTLLIFGTNQHRREYNLVEIGKSMHCKHLGDDLIRCMRPHLIWMAIQNRKARLKGLPPIVDRRVGLHERLPTLTELKEILAMAPSVNFKLDPRYIKD